MMIGRLCCSRRSIRGSLLQSWSSMSISPAGTLAARSVQRSVRSRFDLCWGDAIDSASPMIDVAAVARFHVAVQGHMHEGVGCEAGAHPTDCPIDGCQHAPQIGTSHDSRLGNGGKTRKPRANPRFSWSQDRHSTCYWMCFRLECRSPCHNIQHPVRTAVLLHTRWDTM